MKNRTICILCFIIVLFVISFNVEALTYGGCEYSVISRLKSLVSNVNISYDYYIKDNSAYFNINISNIVPGFYFVDPNTNLKYDYSKSTDGEITIYDVQKTTGNYKFYSNLSECYGVKLGNIYYTLPTYNNYYADPICENNRNFSLCQKWVKVNYSYNQLSEKINNYNKKDEQIQENENIETTYKQNYLDAIVKFYIKYYYFILIGIIVVCVTLMIISKKRNSFDL